MLYYLQLLFFCTIMVKSKYKHNRKDIMAQPKMTQQSIYQLLSDRKHDFLIPEYQRPYAWTEDQCQT